MAAQQLLKRWNRRRRPRAAPLLRCCGLTTLLVVLALALLQLSPGAQAWSIRRARRFYTLLEAARPDCQPEALPPEERCGYVLEHRAECAPRSGLLDYLSIYYCWGLQNA